MNFKNFTG